MVACSTACGLVIIKGEERLTGPMQGPLLSSTSSTYCTCTMHGIAVVVLGMYIVHAHCIVNTPLDTVQLLLI